MIDGVVDALSAAVTGNGSQRSKQLGRTLLAIVALANLAIFYNNVRNILADGDTLDENPSSYLIKDKETLAQLHSGRPELLGHAPLPGRQQAAPVRPPPVHLSATGEFLGAQARPMPGKAPRKVPVFVSLIKDEADMALLRRFVGSLHHWHPGAQVVAYTTVVLSEQRQSEVESWADVSIVPVTDVLRDLSQDFELRSIAQGQGVIGYLSGGVGAWEGTDGAGDGGASDTELQEAAMLLTEWHPVVLYHAARKWKAAVLIEPWGVLLGWIDHVMKALVRDGTYFVCQKSSQASVPGVVGYAVKGHEVSRRLCHQAGCSLGAPCAELPTDQDGSNQNAGSTLVGEAAQLWTAEAGETCHSAAETNIDVTLRTLDGGGSDPDALGMASISSQDDDNAGRSQRLTAKYSCLVRLRDGAGLTGEVQHSSVSPAYVNAHPDITIAIGVPTTTRGTQLMSAAELPVVTAMLPSLLATIDPESTRYGYTLYIGYEVGDRVLDNSKKLGQLHQQLLEMIATSPIALKLICFPATGSTTVLWNALFYEAGEQGADYFLASHDDTEFILPAMMGGAHTRRWSDALVEALLANPMQANFGVAAPTDRRNLQAITHPMVHIPSHRDIFGTLYPSGLGNQEHEEWISRVYGARSTFLLSTVGVYNGHRFSGRAHGCKQGKDAVDYAVEDGALQLKAWVESQMDKYSNEIGGQHSQHVLIL